MSVLAEELRANGFAIVRNVLSSDEIARLRMQLDGYFESRKIDCRLGAVEANAICEAPEISWVFCHHGILRAVKEALNTDTLIFVDGGFTKNVVNGWHKDVGLGWFKDGGYFKCFPFDQDDCLVYKVAIYLEDHEQNECGLSVRRASHRSASLEDGKIEQVRTRVGDIVIFDTRLTHRGQDHGSLRRLIYSLRLRAPRPLGRTFPPEFVWNELEYLAESCFYLRRPARRGVFFAYGIVNDRTREYGRRCLQRERQNDPKFKYAVREDVAAKLREVNVLLVE